MEKGFKAIPVNKNIIHFYRIKDPFGCFSNFAPYPIVVEGKLWPTSEHYFQAKKFDDPVYQEKIRLSPSPMEAAKLGRDRTVKINPNWEIVKDEMMRIALRAKFTQHEDLREILLSTKDAWLVEHTVKDRYWGDGGDGTGLNKLGELLMQLRENLRSEIVEEE